MMAGNGGTPFGDAMRLKEFRFNPNLAPCNNGSYGVVPSCVREFQHSLHALADSDNDTWYREGDDGLTKRWRESLEAACRFIGTKYENTFFVQNVSAGVNAVVKSVALGKGDALLISNVTYNAVKQTCLHSGDDTGAEVLTVDVPVKGKKEVVQAYADFIKDHPNIKLAVIDHITSNTAWVMPVKDLIQLFQRNNILVCVDGAHAPGQVPLLIEDWQPDFYTGNFYKWLFAPRGAAFLWVHPKHHGIMSPVVTSHNYKTTLHRSFYMQGTRDDTPYYCVPAAIEFYERIGGMAAIAEYNSKLSKEARDYLVKSWNTEGFPLDPEDEAPFMKSIRLPDIKGYGKKRMDGERLMDEIFAKYGVRCRISPIWGNLWVRISSQVYNSMEDYKRLNEAICELAGI